MNDLLFVYGSLLNTDNAFAIYLKNNSQIFGPGEFKGRLYDIGEYPGAIADSKSRYTVKGSILSLNDPKQNLSVLDDYEGFGLKQLQPNLFIRKLLPVETPNDTVNCWIYLYNLSISGLIEIPSGDYLAYLSQQKKR